MDLVSAVRLPGWLKKMPHAIGDRLQHFEILAHLGAGGMGEVYKARDARISRLVAIKVLSERFSDRFEREARAISALNHPHICTLYDVGPGYLVMELVEGETLAARLQKGRLPIDLVLRYGNQIADALATAHASGIIHRDLKPGNLMVTKSGIKVLDFGLAKITHVDETLTASHVIQGTPAYMAPEQLEGSTHCDARTDIYALGLVLYEMATGKRLKQGEVVSLEGLPERFAHVLEKCVKSEPEDRWQSARDVRSELEWASKSPALESRSKLSLRWAWALAALACAGLVIAAILLFRYSNRPSAEGARVQFSVFSAKGTTFGGGGPSPAVSPRWPAPGVRRAPLQRRAADLGPAARVIDFPTSSGHARGDASVLVVGQSIHCVLRQRETLESGLGLGNRACRL